MNRATATTLLAASICAALAGCGTSEPAATPTVEPSVTTAAPASPSPTSDPQRDPARQAIDAYLVTQRAFVAASRAGDPNFPALTERTAGQALKLLQGALTTMQEQGLRGRGETLFHPAVDSMQPAQQPTKIRVRDCMDTRDSSRYKADGSAFNDAPGGFRLVLADLEITSGTWKVTGLAIHKVGSCKP
ncbi:hypothetical protein GCM10009661_28890 [Catellatospora chokoriensis]|uniref:Lipoprotein n=2 Tax=Catellatospora chokoriensis TaxID=310353 RepID=A0A8J3NSZ2_9ACTN|nr:hypothetical protein Cch02nite_32240 [Catellatospora chokoriensis]